MIFLDLTCLLRPQNLVSSLKEIRYIGYIVKCFKEKYPTNESLKIISKRVGGILRFLGVKDSRGGQPRLFLPDWQTDYSIYFLPGS